MDELLSFLHRAGALKNLKRQGWVLKKVPNPESVADHSYRVSLMAMLFAKKEGLDENKCIKMGMIHDLGESITGDFTPHDNITSKEKISLEKSAMQTITRNIENDETLALWEEYAEHKTPESCFMHELDVLEMVFQAIEYERKYKGKNIDFSEFWKFAQSRIAIPSLVTLFEALKKERSLLMQP